MSNETDLSEIIIAAETDEASVPIGWMRLDDDAVAYGNDIAGEIVKMLGESPEAWRGAQVVSDFVLHALGRTLEEHGVEGKEPPMLAFYLMVPFAILTNHPCWPKED